MSVPKYTGSCHCGFIKYEVSIPVEKQTLSLCNCTICQKTHYSVINLDVNEAPKKGADGKVNTEPLTSPYFKLLSPKSVKEIKNYQPNIKSCHRYFCDKCGVHVWGCGRYEMPSEGSENGEEMIYDFFGVNANTLDHPQEGLDVRKWKVTYWDGLNDNWMAGTKDEPWPGSVP